MDTEQLILMRLHAQHLLAPVDPHEAVTDLIGIQAQYAGNARHALNIRSSGAPERGVLVKTWTLRGTLHLHAADDLPTVLHSGCRTDYGQRAYTSGEVEPARCDRFRNRILCALGAGDLPRAELKRICEEDGMTKREADVLFEPWGGLIRSMAERGEIAYAAEGNRMITRLAPFAPLDEAAALESMARRYIAHYGPVSLRDAQTFFGKPQRMLAPLFEREASETAELDGTVYYCAGNTLPPDASVPDVLFLAGFDPLLMGYRKTGNPVLPPECVKAVYNNAGIVFPAVLLNGTVCAVWKAAGRRLCCTPVRRVGARDRKRIARAGMDRFGAAGVKWMDE